MDLLPETLDRFAVLVDQIESLLTTDEGNSSKVAR